MVCKNSITASKYGDHINYTDFEKLERKLIIEKKIALSLIHKIRICYLKLRELTIVQIQ